MEERVPLKEIIIKSIEYSGDHRKIVRWKGDRGTTEAHNFPLEVLRAVYVDTILPFLVAEIVSLHPNVSYTNVVVPRDLPEVVKELEALRVDGLFSLKTAINKTELGKPAPSEELKSAPEIYVKPWRAGTSIPYGRITVSGNDGYLVQTVFSILEQLVTEPVTR